MIELTRAITEYSDAALRNLLKDAQVAHEVENDAFMAAQDEYYADESNSEKLAQRDKRQSEVLRLFNLIRSIEADMIRRFTM